MVGALMFVQLAGLIAPFVLILPMTAAGFLEDAVRASPQVRFAALLLLANGAVTVGIAIAVHGALREAGRAWGPWLIAASVAWFAAQAVDNALLLTMLSLSEQYSGGAGAGPETLQAAGTALGTARQWTHYSALLVIECWFLLFYSALLVHRLVPRGLAGLGVAMAAVHAGAVTLPAFLEYPATPSLAVSLAVSHVPLGAWLTWRGFAAAPAAAPGIVQPATAG
jgi:hypothetical protein